MEFQFSTDEDTARLFEIAVHFLQKYFDYDEDKAIHLTNEYYNRKYHDDDFYHHESSFQIAVRIHFYIGLKSEEDFFRWKLDNGFSHSPRYATDYFREHYYDQHRNGPF